MINAELNIYGENAIEFHNMMNQVDLNSLQLRDDFISDTQIELAEDGSLIIECPDINLEIQKMANNNDAIEVILKNNCYSEYVDTISVNIVHDRVQTMVSRLIDNEKYKEESYAKVEMNSCSQKYLKKKANAA